MPRRSMNKQLTAACLLILAVSLPYRAESGETELGISPELLTGDSLGDLTAGLSYDVHYRRSRLAGISPGEAATLLEITLDGTVALDNDINNRALVSEVMAGFSVLGGRARKQGFTPGMDPNAVRGGARDINNRGFFHAGLDLRHEAEQTFDEQNLAAGLELGYINPRDEAVFSYIPSVILAYEYVKGIASDIEEDAYSRLRIEASLKSGFGRQVFEDGFLQPLGLRLDGRYYAAWSMDNELREDDQDEVTYFAAALTYSHQAAIAGLERPTFFIRLSDGRIPPNPEDSTTVSLGVIVPVFE